MELPGFEIIERIGEGSMAVVWKAHQLSLDRDVAIKVLKREFARDPREISDFIQEARSAARVKHPNIVQVFDVAELDDVFYIVMELVDGSALGAALAARGPIQPRKALGITMRVADALDKAWSSTRIIHRDVKPDNILIERDGTVKLADLGLAMIADPAHSSAARTQELVAGTPNYMAPEQIRGDAEIDCRADMYSLGATLYHMVTGNMPFAGNDAQTVMRMQVSEQLSNPRNVEPSIPLGVSQLVERMMMKRPDHRFKDWREAMKTMKKVASGGMLLGRKGEDVTSTVGALKTKAGEAPTQPKRHGRRRRIPLLVQLPLWLLLGCWLSALAYYRLTKTAARPVDEPHAPAPRQLETPKTSVAVSRTVGPARHVVHMPPAHPTLLKQLEADRAAMLSMPKYDPPQTDAMTAEERELYARTCAETAGRLLAGELKTAHAVIDSALRKPSSQALAREFLRLKAFTDEATGTEGLVTRGLLGRVGQETTLHYKGEDRRVLLQAMSGDNVRGVLIETRPAGVVSNALLFTVSSLDPIERSRWIGPANSPARCVMKFLLYFDRGDFRTAVHFAENCGPFAEAFTEVAGQRMLSTN